MINTTIGAIPYVVVSLAIFGCLLMVFGMILDFSLETDNQLMSDPDLPYSMERAGSMNLLVMCFNSLGFVALCCAGIFLVMNGVQSQSGEL